MGTSIWLKRKFKKFKLKMYQTFSSNAFSRTAEISEYDKICGAICRKLISNPESKFSIAPLSEKRYIINKNLGIFIVMEDHKVDITNHVYHYNIKLNLREAQKLRKMFDRKVESIREDYEMEIKSQINNTLHKIYDKVMGN
jgi:hypothetical protein